MMLTFNTLLRAAKLNPAEIRLVRHCKHGRERQRLFLDAIARDSRFETFQSVQSKEIVITQFSTAAAIAAFIPDMTGNSVFVGLWKVFGKREGFLPDPYIQPIQEPIPGSVVFDLRRMPELDQYVGRLACDWGGGEKSWVQYADRQEKEIVELLRDTTAPPFPGYVRFTCSLDEVELLPQNWVEALALARGIYLLVHRQDGAQYIGSANGADGFIGRWRAYSDGHGGNVAMKELAAGADQYDVCILETVGSGATVRDVSELESLWKKKLGSRAHGLTRN